MDSKDEHMHDNANDDVESLDSDRDSKFIDNDDDTEDNDFADETTSKKEQQQNYTILNEKDISRLKKLFDKQCQTMSGLNFVTEAWIQIVECRRVLKWTYAYGFYIPEHEHTKKRLFEYLQGEAELGLERLHDCAENELQKYLNSDGPSEDTSEFRKNLVGVRARSL